MSSRNKTVCMLIYNYFPNITGGAERQCRLQAQELVRTGYRCIVLTARIARKDDFKENDSGCEIIRIPVVQPLVDMFISLKKIWKKSVTDAKETTVEKEKTDVKAGTQKGILAISVQWLNTLAFMFGAFWFLYRNKNTIDVIHTHIASWNAGFVGWVGSLLHIPTICKAAYLPPFHYFGNSIPFADKWREWRKRIHYIALLPEMAKNLYEQGVPEEYIYIIPNGVSIPVDLSPVEFNISVLYVGNFSQGSGHKGFDILLKAWSILCRELPYAQLIIAGGGEKGSWEEMARELGCYDNIEFLGYVQDTESLYKKAGLFVLPSRGEGMSNALLEAQSYGIPCVVTDIPGNREIVIDQKTGIIVPVDDHKQFSDAIVKLITNKVVRVKMGIAARENTNQKYSIEKVVKQVKEIYCRI